MQLSLHRACAVAAVFAAVLMVGAQQQPGQPQPPDEIPTTDAQSGPCSIDLTMIGTNGKPIFAARVSYQTAYGFLGKRQLDMTVYSNDQGKARFTGIPAKVRRPPIEFHASKGDLVGLAVMDPASECQAKHDILMDKAKPAK